MRAAVDGLAEGKVDMFFALISDNVVWTVIGTTPLSGTHHGKAAFAARVAQPLQARFAEPLRTEPKRILADGDHVVVLFDGITTLVTGDPYHNTYCWVLRFDHGQIVEATTYWDTELVSRAMA
jgi:ketosteroid isomerase-like protein